MSASKWKSVPKDQQSLYKELVEIAQSKNDTKRKHLLASIVATRRIKRPSKQGYIFFMSSSGAGKSSTVNHLFNLKTNGIAKTNDRRSETMNTQEYILQSDCDEYEVANLTLGIVDTPGFGDTGGTKQEACNMFSIKTFVKDKLDSNYPNLIIICFDATDVRFEGDNSNFAKLMKSINKLKLVDLNNPNVVAVITKCCSLKPDYQRRRKGWVERINWLMNEVKEIIEIYLHVEVPVVILENDPEEDLPRQKTEDGSESDFAELPTGDYQPLNLYKACQEVLDKNKDMFGKICFNNAFLNGNMIKPKVGDHVEANNAFIHDLNLKEKRLLKFLEDTNRSIAKNYIKRKGVKYIDSCILSEEKAIEVRSISKRLNIMGFFSKEDLRYVTFDSLRFHLGFDPSDTGKSFICDKLKITIHSDQSKICYSLSRGYNLFRDQLCHQIYHFSDKQETFGLILPKDCKFTKFMIEKSIFELSEDQNLLKAKRLKYLDMNFEIDPNGLEYNRRPGFQLINKSDSKLKDHSHFEYFESWQFEIDMKELEPKFSDNFVNAVNELPNCYDSSNNRNQFENFFNKFGHFTIKKAYGGGSYENSADAKGCVGGHKDFESISLTPDLKKKWIASIITNPILLTTNMSLESISSAVEKLDKLKSEGVASALQEILKCDYEKEFSRLSTQEKVQSALIQEEKHVPLTRREAVEDDERRNITILDGIIIAIIGLLAIGLFPITIIVAIVMKAKLG